MVDQLKIYLGDLTYNTVSITSDVFPLNVGYVAAFCKKNYGDLVDIKLFKYIDKLEKALEDSPPDVLGLSNYTWNHRLGLNFFRILLQKNPNAVTVWGGPNFPPDLPSQKEFMKKYSEVDVYVPIDGEVGFSNLIGKIIEINSKKEIKQKLLDKPIDGCMTRDTHGELQYSIPVIRMSELDEIPSPYLTGSMDEFFDGSLTPMFQTNRGCPFQCTFCNDGSSLVQKVNMFSIERVSKELEYAAKRVSDGNKSILISDLNFGMYPRDLQICSEIVSIQQRYNGFPEQIQTTTGKNNKKKIIDAIKLLGGALRLSMSVQSLDEEVLKNVKRSNISTDHLLALGPTIKESNLGTDSEVIIGLPGETYQSHIDTLRNLMRAQIDHILVFTCMMLMGSELNTPESRKKFGLKTKFRVLVRDFAKLNNGKNVVEVEEVLVASDSLSFDQYLELRTLDFIIYMVKIGVLFDPLLKFLTQLNLDTFELPFRMLKNANHENSTIFELLNEFKNESKKELWDSQEELLKKYESDDEYKKLLIGGEGINILHFFTGTVVSKHLEKWIEYTFKIAHNIIQESKFNQREFIDQLNEIKNFCLGMGKNICAADRLSDVPEFTFNYDVKKWSEDKNNLPLNDFKFPSPKIIRFYLSKKQYWLYQEHLENYGDTRIEKAELVKRIAVPTLWRIPRNIDNYSNENEILTSIESIKITKNTYANRKYAPKRDN